ncbi:unnamed protein product [Ceutorhynchus assimilis]|uniref:Cytochrome P450 n=1 Tax=Ceutorhynchus assimilis TaxID=467358 RepID=A0A9N9MM14_9CUCU|nr:unnamed protein product [Ceutorhynchus assimilis]
MLTEILLIILSAILSCWFYLNECKRPKKYPPGPSWIPFIGNGPELRQLAKQCGGQHLAFSALASKFDTEVVGLKLGKENVICVCSYDTVKQVLTSQQYQGRPDNFFMRLRSFGLRKGITGVDGELWKEQRAFLVSHLRALGFGRSAMEEMIKEEIKDILNLIENSKEGIDLSATVSPSVVNILWKLTSGKSIKNNNDITKLLDLLKQRSKAFDMSGGFLNHYPWLRHLAPQKTGYSLLQTINNQIRQFIMEAVNEHKSQWTEGRSDDFIYSFLGEMKKQNYYDNSNFTDDQLIIVCLDILIAGSTTTNHTIDFAFLAMILYPEIQAKVHKCLDTEFKKDEDINYNDKQRVPYIEAVLLECQRMFAVVPMVGPRRVLSETSLSEFIIPKDTTVLINLHSVHHDKDYWKDPEIFKPERFLDADTQLICSDRILTFGLGKRRCLGDALAKSCIFLFFVEILRRYRIESSEKLTGKQVPGITMSPEKYKAKFVARF